MTTGRVFGARLWCGLNTRLRLPPDLVLHGDFSQNGVLPAPDCTQRQCSGIPFLGRNSPRRVRVMFVLVTQFLGPCPESAAPTMPLSSPLPSARGAWAGSGPGTLSWPPCLRELESRGCLLARELPHRSVSAGEMVGAFGDLVQRTRREA